MANKRSPLWNYFEIEKGDAKYVVCLICKLKLSRGGEGKKAGTSSMKNHLQSKHPDKFSEIYGGPSSTSCGGSRTFPSTSSFASTSAPAQSASHKQLTLAETVERKQYWGINDSKSKEYHYLIGEMIALDNEPLSMVHRVDFNRLMHKAVPRYKIPSRSHTGENIANELHVIAARWNIPLNKIHIVVHDSGANMVKGVRVAEYDSARCFIHSLQRVITESLKCQPDLMEMLAASRRIVTHFNHSGLAQEKLKAIQKELNLPEHQLVQDVSTRWNSTYYLQERLLEQKRAVSLYIADHDKLSNLTPHQWNLMEQCISLLKPFEEITKITSSGLSCISKVIPHVATFMRYLQKEETARKVPNLLHVLMSLKTEIEQRFQHLDEDPKYFLATLLDPRFKTSFFGIIQTEKARQKLLLEGLKMSCSEEDSNSSESDSPFTTI
ncbi:zinc finger BED domain-containing protein 4-like [Epargyreus clarus]|uniref:zinc finger BED domain-containing protein 4-like n=1 Tax=Epargyreus clarus TaxID=520877 RepID=UPI003C2BCAFA